MKEVKFEDLKKANDTLITTDIKGKGYVEVNQRIKAFRMVYPTGFIISTMPYNQNGVCIFTTEVGFYKEDGTRVILATGTAYEKENSTFINKTSFIENCETSAVGRALGIAGFGIDTSVASAEEVENAIANQEEAKATPKQVEILSKYYTGDNLKKLLDLNNIDKLEDITLKKASELIGGLNGK